MARVWKYPLKLKERQHIEVPIPCKFASLQLQNGTPTMWLIVDPEYKRERVCIITATTGFMEVDDKWQYLGTFQVGQIGYVAHVFAEEGWWLI